MRVNSRFLAYCPFVLLSTSFSAAETNFSVYSGIYRDHHLTSYSAPLNVDSSKDRAKGKEETSFDYTPLDELSDQNLFDVHCYEAMIENSKSGNKTTKEEQLARIAERLPSEFSSIRIFILQL